MTVDRDVELGAALQSLPTPEHKPGFWDELAERLAGEPAVTQMSGRPRRRFAPPALWLLSAAAVVVLLAVVAVVDREADNGTRLRVTPPAAATLQEGRWAPLSKSPLSARSGHLAVWTGTRMLVWGGDGPDNQPLADGAAYDPSTGRWEPMAASPTGPLFGATAVWTGTRMLVWGGAASSSDDPGSERGTGAAYDPATDTWAPIGRAPLPTVAGHVAVWTGERMLVWGGSVGEVPVADGAAYDPSTGRWTRLAAAPIAPRWDHTAVWTGERMIVWGGLSGEESESTVAFADGAAYDPTTDSWTTVPAAPVVGRASHAAIWSGSAMVIWGGTGATSGLLADGAAYDPSTRTWKALPASPLGPRMFETAVAADRSMVVWGGTGERGDARADGAAYDPAAATWSPLPRSPLPPRARHTAVWTGEGLIVWGGSGDGQALHADGAILRPGDGRPQASGA